MSPERSVCTRSSMVDGRTQIGLRSPSCGGVGATVRHRVGAAGSHPASLTAAAAEAEADAAQTDAAEAVVVVPENEPFDSDGMEHFTDHRCKSWYTNGEALRQSRLSRWQAQK